MIAVEFDKKIPDEEMPDLMELDVTDGNTSTKSVLSPSVGEQGCHSGDEHRTASNGAIETDDTDDDDEEVPVKKKEDFAGNCANESLVNGFLSHSEDETEVADNDTASNLESSIHHGPVSSPSSLHEVECDPIDTLKG